MIIIYTSFRTIILEKSRKYIIRIYIDKIIFFAEFNILVWGTTRNPPHSFVTIGHTCGMSRCSDFVTRALFNEWSMPATTVTAMTVLNVTATTAKLLLAILIFIVVVSFPCFLFSFSSSYTHFLHAACFWIYTSHVVLLLQFFFFSIFYLRKIVEKKRKRAHTHEKKTFLAFFFNRALILAVLKKYAIRVYEL